MSIRDIHKEMQERSNSTDFYKLQEGSNRMRIMTDFERVESIQRGSKYAGIVSEKNKPQDGDKTTLRSWAWAIIRNESGDDEFKIVQFGSTILNQIVAFMDSKDYGFQKFPMPYDIDIKAKGAGTKEVEYTVIPARQNTDLTEQELKGATKQKTIASIVSAIIAKQDGLTEAQEKAPYPSAESEGIDINKVVF